MRGLLSRRLRPQQEGTSTLSNANGSNSPSSSDPAVPTGAQLAAARLKQWHQQGEALLTLENLRGWVQAAGLVLFAPRPQIVAPAPSLVEAVLGEANATPTLEQTAEARSLLARLVADGLGVPLNLLGASGPGVAGAIGETPDFVCSTAVFSYVFTLRGDKAWKQPPATTGALRVSQLALAIFEALTRRGPLTTYDLTTEVGKEVTEAAVLRALGELWTHLRVLPLAMPDGQATVWELASARFTKQIKAGANAGQPSALSALISLYLGQAVVASEDEIESFLSPLAARSRIRDVIHALLSARQLTTLAIAGRTVLHVAGELPAFLAPAVPEMQDAAASETVVPVEAAAATGAAEAEGGGASRITKYVPKPRKIGTGYLAKASPAKFAGRPFAGERQDGTGFRSTAAFKPGFKTGAKPGFKPSGGFGEGTPGRERRPFSKPAGGGAGRGFEKPWEEEKARRLAAAAKPSEVSEAKPADLAASAATPQPELHARTPRKPFAKTFSKPGTFGRKRDGIGGKRPSGDSRTGKGEAAPRKPYPSRGAGFFSGKPRPSDSNSNDRPDRPARPQQAGRGQAGPSAESGKRVYRKFDAPRDRPARPFSSGRPTRAGGAAGKPRGDFAPRKFADKTGGFPGKKPARPGGFADRPGATERKSFAKPSGFAGKKPFGKAGGSFAGKRPFGKAGSGAGAKAGGKPAGPFAKFAGGKKPFGKRPPARKFKAREDESA
jgi:hypothetical protein